METNPYAIVRDGLLIAALLGGLASLTASAYAYLDGLERALNRAMKTAAVSGGLAAGSALVGWATDGRLPLTDLRASLCWLAAGLMAFGAVAGSGGKADWTGAGTLFMGLLAGVWAARLPTASGPAPSELSGLLLAPHVALCLAGMVCFSSGAAACLLILTLRRNNAAPALLWGGGAAGLAALAVAAGARFSSAELMSGGGRYAAFVFLFIGAVVFLCASFSAKLRKALAEGAARLVPSEEKIAWRQDRLHALGLLLFGAGVLCGSIWADLVWGQFWSWDRRQSWSLAVLLLYAAALQAKKSPRWTPASGARWGLMAYAVTVVGFVAVQFLEAGNHDYSGF